ncbi:MAG: hypothetical protein WC757_02510 [Candidatus Paceibacterota bacterium]|jgi:hypothetical protein
MKRIIVDIILCIAAVFLPWWGTLIAVLACMFIFEWFIEGLILALIFDTLYGTPTVYFNGYVLVATYSTTILFMIVFFVKRRIRLYNQ